MTVKELLSLLPIKPLSLPDAEREVEGVYMGDLLSWVMGRAKANQALVTIMTNVNVVAVASLLDLSLVVMCDGAMPDEDVILTANAKEVNMASFEGSVYELCSAFAKLGL